MHPAVESSFIMSLAEYDPVNDKLLDRGDPILWRKIVIAGATSSDYPSILRLLYTDVCARRHSTTATSRKTVIGN